MLKITCFWTLVALASCQSILTYNRTLPPEIPVEGYRDCQVISLHDTTQVDFTQDKKVEVYQNSYKTLLNTLVAGLQNWLALNTQLAHSPRTLSPGEEPSYQKVLDSLDQDLIVILKHFDLYRDYEVEVSEDEEGNKSKTAYYYLVAKADFTFFDANREMITMKLQASELIDERFVLSGLLAIGPNIGNKGPAADSLGKRLGRQFLEKFIPSEVTIARNYFSGGKLKQVKPFFKSQNWIEAEKLLLDLWEKDDDNIKEKIAHNLAVLYEATGNVQEHMHWKSRGWKPTLLMEE